MSLLKFLSLLALNSQLLLSRIQDIDFFAMTGKEIYDIMPEFENHDQSNHQKDNSCLLVMPKSIKRKLLLEQKQIWLAVILCALA